MKVPVRRWKSLRITLHLGDTRHGNQPYAKLCVICVLFRQLLLSNSGAKERMKSYDFSSDQKDHYDWVSRQKNIC